MMTPRLTLTTRALAALSPLAFAVVLTLAALPARAEPPATASKPVYAQEEPEAAGPKPYIGQLRTIKAREEDTLLQIMRDYRVGYVEIRAANPDVDVWLPGEGTPVVIPSMHLIPEAPREGIVINLSEMRMYSFVKDPNNPETFPVGIGREGLGTPLGATTIQRKKEGPTWRPTPRMRKEHPELPAEVPPGPENPLGTHALYLGWPSYLIHGTDKPWSLGRRASSGCIRMYPEDIVTAFKDFPIGTKVRTVRQPVKVAWIGDKLYLEAHAEGKLADNIEAEGVPLEYDVPESLFAQLRSKLGRDYQYLDWEQVRTILKERRGYPIEILSRTRIAKAEEDKARRAAEKEATEQAQAESSVKTAQEKDAAKDEKKPRREPVRRGFN